MPRLRKMQALVRGFLTRRKIYPPLLQEYTISKAVLNLILSNFVYKEASMIILEEMTYMKYQPKKEGDESY